MPLPHAQVLARARSCIAALADQARSHEASSAYEHVLMMLDRLHDDESPALDAAELVHDRAVLFALASSTIQELAEHGIDALEVELLLAMLEDAQALDAT